MKKGYGNIKNITLLEALEESCFKELWNIGKDKVYVCKDCEFRYICTDYRAYLKSPTDEYSKPDKCS